MPVFVYRTGHEHNACLENDVIIKRVLYFRPDWYTYHCEIASLGAVKRYQKNKMENKSGLNRLRDLQYTVH